MTDDLASFANRFDYVVIGSGFGGSVSACRLAEKGYRVLVVERGRRFQAGDFSRGTSRPGRWLWIPQLGMRGIMKLTFLRHVTAMHGVGVGGGSLVYGATLPTPKDRFFKSGTWAGLRDWKAALGSHYKTARTMLGAVETPRLTGADTLLRKVSASMGREDSFQPTDVGIYFAPDGQAGKPVADPYFDGKGPPRRGCIECGDCMTGCRHNAKNSLDKNYLFLAERNGVRVVADTEAISVRPAGLHDGSQGYHVELKPGGRCRRTVFTGGVVFAGGVLGTVPLLLKLRECGALPRLSPRVGQGVRTNNESLTAVTALGPSPKFNDGVAIGSIFHPDAHSHVEPIRLGAGSGLWRLLVIPMVGGRRFLARLRNLARSVLLEPLDTFRAWFARDFSERTVCLLFMQHLNSSITLARGRLGGLKSRIEPGEAPPSADIALSDEVARHAERIIGGKAMRPVPDSLFGTPTTAHILGGAVMGADADVGVIDWQNRVFNYQNLYVCDGSAISANPGVNPSLSIAALTEHAMSMVPAADA
ncbi:MAG: GMC oxidoreductase [Pseudomonadota bacterium]